MKSDPTNYRGICVSSCLGKLFCSILNRRLHLYFEENKILHNSQIGFLPENRTADHVFTLRTLRDKYVHYHKEKVYACFVDFHKAFDSVWHEGLFYKLLKTNIGGVAAPVFRPFLLHISVADFCPCALVWLCFRPRGPFIEPGKA